MPTKKTIYLKDIDSAAQALRHTMHHTHELLMAGADSASHMPITSLLVVAATACGWASEQADLILSSVNDEVTYHD